MKSTVVSHAKYPGCQSIFFFVAKLRLWAAAIDIVARSFLPRISIARCSQSQPRYEKNPLAPRVHAKMLAQRNSYESIHWTIDILQRTIFSTFLPLHQVKNYIYAWSPCKWRLLTAVLLMPVVVYYIMQTRTSSGGPIKKITLHLSNENTVSTVAKCL